MDTLDPSRGNLLKRLIPSTPWRVTLLTGLGLAAGGMVALMILAMILTPTLPPLESLGEDRLKVPLRVYTADNVLIGEFGEERRIPVTMEQVPLLLIEAILAAEDDAFYEHGGVDFMGIARAAWINFRTGQRSQGASTITMQVTRNFFLSPERTYTRKLKEILLSFKIERELNKQQILELYMNKIFLGHRAYGFAAAAKVYYGKELQELTLPEIAMLAGLPKAPSRNNPISRPQTAMERRNYVLRRMHKLAFIDQAVMESASTAPLAARKHSLSYDVEAPYIAEMVRQYMMQTYDEQAYGGGFHVYTTIHSKYQQAANAALRKGLLEYDQRHGYRGSAGRAKIKADTEIDVLDEELKEYRRVGNLLPAIVRVVDKQSFVAYTEEGEDVEVGWEGISWARKFINQNSIGSPPKQASRVVRVGDIIYLSQTTEGLWRLAQVPTTAAALVSLRPNDGAILALSGGFDFTSSKFNRVTQAERQAGSNLKPFIYSAGLEKGFTAASTISGAPISIEASELEEVWQPHNYSGKFYGPTRLRKALILSLNLVSVRLLRAIGAGYTVDYLRRFGFEREKLPRNLSLALGSASVTPLTMARAFGVFANGGFLVEPYFITRIEDADHNVLELANPLRVCLSCPQSKAVQAIYQTSSDDAETNPDTQAATPPAEKVVTSPVVEPQAVVQSNDGSTLEPRFAPRVITAQNAFIMTSIMQDVVKRGTARRALELKREDISGKTGTTNEYRDAWFSGFNPDVVTTTWIGFDQPQTMGRGEAGSRAALPIWIDYMRVALADSADKPLAMPSGVIKLYINSDTGQIVPAPPEAGAEDGELAGDLVPAGDDDLVPPEDEEQKVAEGPEIIEEYFIEGQTDISGNLLAVEPGSEEHGNTGGSQPPGENLSQELF